MKIKLLSVQELNEMSLSEVKKAFNKLLQTYSRRMYEREKENAELSREIYGPRLTAGQLEKDLMREIQSDLEKNRYIAAYQSLVSRMGGAEGGTKKSMGSYISTARAAYQGTHFKEAPSDIEAIRNFKRLSAGSIVSHDDFYNWYYSEMEELGDKSEVGSLYKQLDDKEAVKKRLKDKYDPGRYFGL